MKFVQYGSLWAAWQSRPAWGAWIEIVTKEVTLERRVGRAPHGARGLKYGLVPAHGYALLVAPRMGRVD